MEIRREGKEIAFQDGTYSLKTITTYTRFYLKFTIIYTREKKRI